MATSEEVRSRLGRFNGVESNVSVFHAGLGFRSVGSHADGEESYDSVLCVSRHEFPKRTELFVQAMSLLPELDGIAVGTGGRLGYVMDLGRRFANGTLRSHVVTLVRCGASMPRRSSPDRSPAGRAA